MGYIGYILSLVWISVLGYLILRIIVSVDKVFYRMEFFVYSLLLGLIAVPLLLFYGSLFGVPLDIWGMNGILIIALFILGIYHYFYGTSLSFEEIGFFSSFMKLSLWKKVALGLVWIWVITKLFIGGMDILSTPTYTDDAFANWNSRAKTWFYAENLILDKESPRFLGGGYKQYPPTVPMAKTYFAKFFGSWNEGVANSFSLLIYLAACAVLFFALYRESASVLLGSIGVYVLTSMPLLHIHGTNPYFDFFMGLYFFIAVYFLFLFLQKKIDYRLPLVFFGLLVYTKTEGLIIFLTTALVCLWIFTVLRMYKKDKTLLNPAIKITTGSLLIGAPFIIFKLAYALGFGNGDASIGTTKLSLHTEIFHPLYEALFFEGNYNLFFFFFLLVTFFHGWKIWKNKNWLDGLFLLAFFGAFGMILFIYLTTFTYQYVLDQTGVNRSMIQILPIGVFVLLYPFSRYFHDAKN